LAYVREDGSPSVSFRGSTYVRSSTELALWERKRDSGLAAAITDHPRVSLLFFEMEGPGARYLAIESRARVAPDLDDEVYGAIIEPERQQDPDRNGVAVVVDVDSVVGASANGFLHRPAADRQQSSCREAPLTSRLGSKRPFRLRSSTGLLSERRRTEPPACRRKFGRPGTAHR
jgi:hypothetical protein